MVDLLAAAKRELARSGAAGLSLRAVARELDLAPSALFRYIANRDDLLTLLLIEAYDDLGEAVEAAERSLPASDLSGRWRSVAVAFRQWALTHRNEYGLLYGTPVPGFHARAEDTNRAGTRVISVLIESARAAPARPGPQPTATELEFIESNDLQGLNVAAGATAWTTLLGAVSAEIFEHLGPDAPYEELVFTTAVGVGESLLLGSRE